MEEIFAKISQYKAYKNDPSLNNIGNIKGQIYELYCYNYILNNVNNINIVKANCITNEKVGNFLYNKVGKIHYYYNRIDLAEFDILGINKKNIYFWEITKSEHGKNVLRNEIERKKELLLKLFPNNNIVFTLILPKIISGYEQYNIEIIKEPNYNEYLENEYFKLSQNINNCIHLTKFCKNIVNYDYINEIINYSKLYFNHLNKLYLDKQYLIERIYDINNIQKNRFLYYSIEDKKYGNIIIKGNNIYKSGEKVKTRNKCYHEINLIREIIKAN
jgi:hypothetical protein